MTLNIKEYVISTKLTNCASQRYVPPYLVDKEDNLKKGYPHLSKGLRVAVPVYEADGEVFEAYNPKNPHHQIADGDIFLHQDDVREFAVRLEVWRPCFHTIMTGTCPSYLDEEQWNSYLRRKAAEEKLFSKGRPLVKDFLSIICDPEYRIT